MKVVQLKTAMSVVHVRIKNGRKDVLRDNVLKRPKLLKNVYPGLLVDLNALLFHLLLNRINY